MYFIMTRKEPGAFSVRLPVKKSIAENLIQNTPGDNPEFIPA
jgi:hypothetical protein